MPFDGAFLHKIKNEINEFAVGSRVEKIFQPSREELVFVLRNRNGAFRLLLTSRADCPRIHFTVNTIENPQTPPMFCMLLRKILQGARFVSVFQPELERVLKLEFSAANELGDKAVYFVIIEIMSRHSNIILVDQNENIVDSVKRVNDSVSTVRQVLPGLTYKYPPFQDKLNILETGNEKIFEKLEEHKDIDLSKALLNTLLGFSPLISREIASYTTKGTDLHFSELKDENISRLRFYLDHIRTVIISDGEPLMLTQTGGKPFDFTFSDINQYGIRLGKSRFDTYSQLVDEFYKEKDTVSRMTQHSGELLKLLANISDRISRKINAQTAELSECADREKYRIYGDLINSNLYKLQKGDLSLECDNYYDEGNPIKIPLDVMKTPVQNSQKYYKNYKKLQNAETQIKTQIEQGNNELVYIDSVLDSLSRATILNEYLAIRAELAEQGYVKNKKKPGGKKEKKLPAIKPLEFISEDGLKILVGRNNKQNEFLTLKHAKNYDIWLHVKDYPGSHVIIESQGQEASDSTIEKAAKIAAFYSKVSQSPKALVDYTYVKFVRKQPGGLPGMVIYTDFKTIAVKPGI